MSLDQQIHGSTDWHLPSPSSTPRSGTFPEANLKTPRTEVLTQSHFLDAWSTPRVNGQHTPVQTPSFTLSTPIERPSSSYSQPVRTPEDPNFHVNYFAPQNLPLPPVEVSRRLSSSPDSTTLAQSGVSPTQPHFGHPRPTSMDFSQIHTPPPTRDASSRRSLQQSAGNGFATPATVIQRTPLQVSTSEALLNQTPFNFSNTQFSPGMMPFANMGPMTAPAMPQSRLFWDQPSDSAPMDVDMPMASDPFGIPAQKPDPAMNWQNFNTPVANPSFQAMRGLSSPGPMASFGNSPGWGQSSESGSFISTTAGVDPSQLFTLSSPGLSTSFGTMPQPNMSNSFSRQPYETQMRDSMREKEIVKKARSQHSRTNTNSSSGSVENTRPVLQRSNTDSGFRKSRPSSAESRTSSQNAASTIPRRSSPLKREARGPLMSIPEIRRPRTRLVVDDSGRARTETIPAEVDEDTPKNVRSTSQRDIRRQYPGLWEEDDTDSEEEEAPTQSFSRNPSFNVPQLQRRSSKHARMDSGDLHRSGSFKMPRPASRPTLDAFDKASFDTVRIVKNPVENSTRRFSMMDFPTSQSKSRGSPEKQVPNSPGNALGALKKVRADMQQKTERAAQNTIKAHNQRWAQSAAELSNATTPHGHGRSHYDPFSNTFNASPNTSELTTPSTDRSSLSSESTRCVCNGTDDGQPMVQCESCTKWLHMGCVGLGPNNLPPVYVCIFCTGQTPIARGGRVRGPLPFDSPLNHKTMFRR